MWVAHILIALLQPGAAKLSLRAPRYGGTTVRGGGPPSGNFMVAQDMMAVHFLAPIIVLLVVSMAVADVVLRAVRVGALIRIVVRCITRVGTAVAVMA